MIAVVTDCSAVYICGEFVKLDEAVKKYSSNEECCGWWSSVAK